MISSSKVDFDFFSNLANSIQNNENSNVAYSKRRKTFGEIREQGWI